MWNPPKPTIVKVWAQAETEARRLHNKGGNEKTALGYSKWYSYKSRHTTSQRKQKKYRRRSFDMILAYYQW